MISRHTVVVAVAVMLMLVGQSPAPAQPKPDATEPPAPGDTPAAAPRVLAGPPGSHPGPVPGQPGAVVIRPGPADPPPPWLPRYDLQIDLKPGENRAEVRQRILYRHRFQAPVRELVFNVHSHYKVPADQIGFLAKTLEILRIPPSDTLELVGHACDIHAVTWLGADGHGAGVSLPFHYRDNDVTLEVPLPHPIECGQAITVELAFTMHLPPKQGRWGEWNGVTFLTNWLPVLAYADECGWHPTPFVPWHQPFYNEMGLYTADVVMPCDHKFACSCVAARTTDLGDGRKRVEFAPGYAREFSLVCSARYVEYLDDTGPVTVRCLAFPEHEFHARQMLRVARDSMVYYAKWLGPYHHPEFTVVESYFGWLGNECSNFIMMDQRVFELPHMAVAYVEYLVAHEVCHQWWYNLIGTNGYHETWMDEGMATYFAHKVLDAWHGKNNNLVDPPLYLKWLPSIERENYRYYGLCGTIARGEAGPVIQDMDKFDHIVNLFSMCYDRGSKVVGLIEQRLGEAAFIDFMHGVYAKYRYRVLHVADFQHELELYTGQPWQDFFDRWLYKGEMVDWCVEKVEITDAATGVRRWGCGAGKAFVECLTGTGKKDTGSPVKVAVLLHQKGQACEPTTLGFSLDGTEHFAVRVPVSTLVPRLQLTDPPAAVEALPDNRVRVEVTLPCEPTQIAVDPDNVLVDSDPSNNYWKPRVRVRVAPIYTLLEETDITTAYDRWNVIMGGWLYGVPSSYYDPWFNRSQMIGLRAGVYRTQEFVGGTYLAYRSDYRDLAVGVDGLWLHWPIAHVQVGFNAERSITNGDESYPANTRATVFGRYVFQYHDSLYLQPMHYAEVFATYQDFALPPPRVSVPGAEEINHSVGGGVHYHLDYLTPYWDPVGGFKFDATYMNGWELGGANDAFYRLDGQFSYVRSLPEGWGWLSDTRVALRAWAGAALPNKVEVFTLGGQDRFRGYDLKDRQGSSVWLGSVEWRFPIATHLSYDFFDHMVGVRNISGAAFYDVGDAYTNGHSVGPVAQAVGGGIRVDMSVFSFVERALLRFDVAKSVVDSRPTQFWFGIGVPF